jgi:hypothetical protein
MKSIECEASDRICVMSQQSKFGTDLTNKQIKRGITKDICFYDIAYFNSRSKAMIDFAYSGNGEAKNLKL